MWREVQGRARIGILDTSCRDDDLVVQRLYHGTKVSSGTRDRSASRSNRSYLTQNSPLLQSEIFGLQQREFAHSGTGVGQH